MSNWTYLNSTSNGFIIKIGRKSTGELILDTSDQEFIYSDRYLRFGTSLSSKYLYGLGENRRYSFRYNTTEKIDSTSTFTIWNKDVVADFNTNLYSSHPV